MRADLDTTLPAVAALLDDALREVVRHERSDLADRLRLEQRRLQRPPCSALVIGEFNKGKSSMINALLNARVCATDADIATAVPTIVRYADELSAATTDADGAVLERIDPAAVEALVTRPAIERIAGTERAGAGAPIGIEMGVPRELLRTGLVIVDTPGMGGGLNSAHAATALRALSGADAVVFVTDAGQELTAPELDLLRRASELCRRSAIALTKIDFYGEWRRIAALNRGHLQRAGINLPIFPLSAPLRHAAVRDGDRQLSARSGYPNLSAFLHSTVHDVRRATAAGAAAAAHSGLSQLMTQLATAQEALVDPASRQDRVAQWTDAKQRAERMRGAAARWQITLSDRIGDMASAVDYDITVRMRTMRRDMADRLAATEPRGWLELEPWLYQRTNDALADHLALIRNEADHVADEVATKFGDAAWELRIEADIGAMGLRSTVAGEETGLAAMAVARASRVELALGAARGGSIAVVATHAAGIVLGVMIPIALPVTMTVSAVLAGVLGRVTWGSARKAQLRQILMEAERAVGGYLDEVEVRARRDSRDAVRRVQEHLREVFTEHAGQLHASTVRNLEVLAESIRAGEQGDRTKQSHTSAELERMRALTARAADLVDQLLGEPMRQPR